MATVTPSPSPSFPTRTSETKQTAPSHLSLVPTKLEPARPQSKDDDGLFDLRRLESLKFMMQMLVSVILLLFCLGKLNSSANADEKALYWGGLSSVIAWWMPSPGGGSKNSPNAQPPGQ